MSNSDSFIDEVTEEVRRDQLYGYLRRYGWIAVLIIVLIVGGASWNEWRKAQAEAQAERLGDAMIAALEVQDQPGRAEAIASLEADNAAARAVLDMLAASELAAADTPERAVARLEALAVNTEVPQVYRDLAAFKALLIPEGMTTEARRSGLEAINTPGQAFRMLALEQLALMDVAVGDTGRALERLQAILEDAEASPAMQQRVLQGMIALGGEPDLSRVLGVQPGAALDDG